MPRQIKRMEQFDRKLQDLLPNSARAAEFVKGATRILEHDPSIVRPNQL